MLDDLQSLVIAASKVPWSGAELLSGSTALVSWESVSTGDDWQHELVWVPCAAGAVAIHRFTPQPGGASSADELARLSELAAEEMAAGGGGESASNVGGYHGARDLWSRPELHEGALPWLVGSAVQQAAAAEAAALQQGLTPTSVDECWFNVLRPGGWNCLHTHAGSTYSAAFFVADGACCDADDPLAGRLAFLPGGPTQAGTADLHARSAPSLSFSTATLYPHCTRFPLLADTLSAPCRGQATAADQGSHSLAGCCLDPTLKHACLLLDPTPGTCVVFPSFVPHLVLPTPAVEAAAAAPLRLSLAFNFGACDPVMAHLLVLSGMGGTVRVKLVLELVDVL